MKIETPGFKLVVADDGPGLPDEFDIAQQTGLGMRLVLSLSRQLDGTFEAMNARGGARFTVFVPGEQSQGA